MTVAHILYFSLCGGQCQFRIVAVAAQLVFSDKWLVFCPLSEDAKIFTFKK